MSSPPHRFAFLPPDWHLWAFVLLLLPLGVFLIFHTQQRHRAEEVRRVEAVRAEQQKALDFKQKAIDFIREADALGARDRARQAQERKQELQRQAQEQRERHERLLKERAAAERQRRERLQQDRLDSRRWLEENAPLLQKDKERLENER